VSLEPLLCGIDAGTSQVRALLFRPDGAVVASAAQPTPTRTLGSDSAELDAEDLWSAIVAVLRRVVAEVPDAKAIRSVAVASVGEAGVLLADDGRSLAPIIAWFDTRTRGALDWLLAHVGFERLHRLTGLCADPTFSLLKLLWLKRHRPDAFGAARHWLNLGDYLAWRLCGERATDLSLASRTMLLDLEHGGWSAPLLEMCGLPSTLLPPLRPSGTRLGRVLPEVAAATGLPSDCVVGVGGHDHVCGMIAAGADAAGVLLDSLGTAEALTLIRDRPITDPALGRDGFNQGAFAVDAPLYYVFGGLPTAAGAVEWFRSLYPGADHATLIAEAEAAAGDSVLFLPHLRLGSPPFPDPVGRGAFLGISSGTSRGTLFRAVLEGIALDGANMLDSMLSNLGARRPSRILAIGGSTRNHLLMRLKAAAFGSPLLVLDLPDTTCLGAALLGAIAGGVFADLTQARSSLSVPVRGVVPFSEWDESYRRRRVATYAAAYTALRPLHARLLEG
jgi:xylulokinase